MRAPPSGTPTSPGDLPRRPSPRTGASDASRRTTDALKAVAILGVVLSHYASHLMAKNPMLVSALNGYMALFFTLSGLGVQASLSRRFAAGLTAKATGRFFLDRFLRIYPAYLPAIWLLSACAGIPYGLAAYSGFVSPYWFITSILHCYLAAPVLFVLLGRLGPGRFAVLVTAAVAVLNLIYGLALPPVGPVWDPLVIFKNVLMGHVLLFAWGMALYARGRRPVSGEGGPAVLGSGWLGATALILCFPAGWLVGDAAFSPWLRTVCTVLYYLLFLAVTLAAWSDRLALPGRRALAAMGKATLLIYLLDPFYYYFVGIRILTPGAATTPPRYAATMALMILGCMALQPLFDQIARLPSRLART